MFTHLYYEQITGKKKMKDGTPFDDEYRRTYIIIHLNDEGETERDRMRENGNIQFGW